MCRNSINFDAEPGTHEHSWAGGEARVCAGGRGRFDGRCWLAWCCLRRSPSGCLRRCSSASRPTKFTSACCRGLAHQATSVALAGQRGSAAGPARLGGSVGEDDRAKRPAWLFAKVTDPAGNVLFVSEGSAGAGHARFRLSARRFRSWPTDEPRVFTSGNNRWEGVQAHLSPATTCAALRGSSQIAAGIFEQLNSVLRSTRHLRRHLDCGFGTAGAAHGPLHLPAAGHSAPRHPRADELAGGRAATSPCRWRCTTKSAT